MTVLQQITSARWEVLLIKTDLLEGRITLQDLHHLQIVVKIINILVETITTKTTNLLRVIVERSFTVVDHPQNVMIMTENEELKMITTLERKGNVLQVEKVVEKGLQHQNTLPHHLQNIHERVIVGLGHLETTKVIVEEVMVMIEVIVTTTTNPHHLINHIIPVDKTFF